MKRFARRLPSFPFWIWTGRKGATENVGKSRRSSGDQKKIINNMGLFWCRKDVFWRGNRKIGKAALRAGAKRKGETDFWDQAGIYALYTSDYRLVYVGQAGIGDKSCIGTRLKQHTRDELAGRWSLFSWFGLRRVKGNGQLGKKFALAYTPSRSVADILEGILIEVAEPPMNSQGGRFGPGVHRYVQTPSPYTPEATAADNRLKAIENKLTQNQKMLQSIKKRLPKQ